MLERYFFDTSAFLAVIRNEAQRGSVEALIASLRRSQRVTSVLVAYGLYRGVHPNSTRRKSPLKELNAALEDFTLKPVHEAQAINAARFYYDSKGDIDPILAAQCVDGGFTLVTTNPKDFERVPGIRMHAL